MQTESVPGPGLPTSPLDGCPDAVVSTDAAGVVLRWNAAAVGMTGLGADAALGRPLAEVLALTPRDETGLFPERWWARCGSASTPVELCEWSSPEAGQALTHRLLRDCSTRVVHESESDRAAEVLRAQARSDALTGLANHYELEDRLDESLSAVRSGHVARRVRQALSDPVQTSEGVLQVGASLGAAVADADTDAADLLRRADKAMYRVKLARG